MRFDYTNAKVDFSNKERIDFIYCLTEMMSLYDSTSDEVNELLNWLYAKVRNNPYDDFCDIKDYDLSKDKILDMNTVRREVSHADIKLWSIISTIHENNSWSDIEDCLQEIINKLYFKLDKVVHPYLSTKRDLINSRYYVELEYMNEEIM